MDLELRGKRALISGASKGIGLAIARGLAAEGCSVRLLARGREALDRAASAISAEYGVEVAVEVADLTDPLVLDALVVREPELDILVNNAGDVPAGNIDDFSRERIGRAWELKLFGYIGLMRAFYSRMAARGSGVIVNVIGTAGYRVDADLFALAGSNAALIAATRALGAAGPQKGVRVVGVNPGATLTDRVVAVLRGQAKEPPGSVDPWEEMQKMLPFGRAARPDEIADAVVFLASGRASYVSGALLNVDGGKCERP